MIRLRIKDWDQHFENAASRKLKRLDWVAIPIKTDGEGYTALVDHPDGAAHLGAWYAIVEVAAKQTPRGHLPGGIPQDIGGICQSLSRMSRLPPGVFHDVLPRLLEIGWIEEFLCNVGVSRKVAESADILAESAATSAKSGATLQDITLQGTTYTHTEPAPSVRAVAPFLKPTKAADLNGQSSQKFETFWERYPRKQHRDAACMEWLSVVTVESEPQVFSCLARYLASDEVSRGAVANPEKWLMEQFRDGWTGDWPKYAPRAQESRETPTQAAIRKAKEAQNGTR